MVTPPLPITGGCASWAGIPSLEPFPEPTDYSYRKIVIQKFPVTLAHGACMAHTSNTGGPWGLARGPRAKGTQEGGCTPLAPRMPLAPPPLPISIKNCSAALREAWPGARVGFRPVARALLSDLRPVGYRLRLEAGVPSHWEGTGCARSLTHPLNMLRAWHGRIHPQIIPGVQQLPTQARQMPRSHLLTCPCHVHRLGMHSPMLGSR